MVINKKVVVKLHIGYVQTGLSLPVGFRMKLTVSQH
jgi:hypothetical protein